MSNMEEVVRLALKDKNPTLFKELSESGELAAFARERAEMIGRMTNDKANQIAVKFGIKDTDDPMEKARIKNGALPMAREIVLAEMLEFPPDETFRERPETTIDSGAPT